MVMKGDTVWIVVSKTSSNTAPTIYGVYAEYSDIPNKYTTPTLYPSDMQYMVLEERVQ